MNVWFNVSTSTLVQPDCKGKKINKYFCGKEPASR